MAIVKTPAQVAASQRGGRPRPGKDPRSRDVARWGKFMARMLRAYGARATQEDPWVVRDMLAARAQLDGQIVNAVAVLVFKGYNWTTIGGELGIGKQAAYKRWARKVAPLVEQMRADQLDRAAQVLAVAAVAVTPDGTTAAERWAESSPALGVSTAA